MSGFPRACFSEKELNATRWYAAKNGVSVQPTIKQVKNHRQDVLNVAGLETKLVDGKLGNCFAVNDWFKILEHVWLYTLISDKTAKNIIIGVCEPARSSQATFISGRQRHKA
jgi:hypothetical protein